MRDFLRWLGRMAGWLGWLAGALALSVAPAASAAAQSAASAQLEIQPATLQLAPGESAQFLLLLHNSTPDPLQNPQLHWFSQAGVVVQSPPPAAAHVLPGATLAWSGQITRTETGAGSGTVYFELSYDEAPPSGAAAGGAAVTTQVAVATLAVQERPVDGVDKIAQVRIETAINQIQEQAPGLMFLVVQNIATIPLTVTRLTPYQPGFVHLGVPDLGPGQVIAPQASQSFPISVTVGNSALAGSQRLLLGVDLAWVSAGRPAAGSLVVGQTVEVGILGETDLLKAVGVPSFLFLPGFLMLSTLILLLTRVPPKYKLDLSAPEFALISITLSLIAAVLYPWITALAGDPRNYLLGYGLLDVLQVWFGSVAVGVLAWAGTAGGLALIARGRRLRAERLAAEKRQQAQADLERRTPAPTDGPLIILQKMELNGVTFPLGQVRVKRQGGGVYYFVIWQPEADKVWVAPAIKLTLKSGADQAPWLAGLDAANGAGPGVMRKFLAEDSAAVWDAQWDDGGAISVPTILERSQFEDLPNAGARAFAELA